jgi:transposase
MKGLPNWAKKYRTKGVAIENREGRYYATRVTSVWDPDKKRARKVTLEYLGVVTPEGIIPPKHKRLKIVTGIKEAGNISFLHHFCKVLINSLQEFWPDSWQSIISAATIKLAYNEPLKRMRFRHETCLTSTLWPEAHLSKNSFTELLERLGRDWSLQRMFFRELSKADSYMAIDLTQIFSDSQNITWLEKGYNVDGIQHDQLKLLLIWGLETHVPSFLKLLPGSITSAHSMINAIQESTLENVVVVGDKGFFSERNVSLLEKHDIHYVLALSRGLPFLQHLAHSRYTNYFIYRKTIQWWREYTWKNRRIIHYLDKQIGAEEESTFIRQVEEKKIPKKELRKNKYKFGTLAILTDLGLSARLVYEVYKQRREIELAFDALRNTLESDKTWMQTREKMQGYFFILFLALHLYSQVLDHLRIKKLLKQYSVSDVLALLSKVYVVNIDSKVILGEIPKSTRKLIDLIEIPITKNLGS